MPFETISGLEQKRSKMCVLDMDEKGDLYLYKFALLCKNEIIERLINGSYHIAESSNGPSTIGKTLFMAWKWSSMQTNYFWNVRFIFVTMGNVYTVKLRWNKSAIRLSLFYFSCWVNLRVLFCLRSWRYTGKRPFTVAVWAETISRNVTCSNFTPLFGKDPVSDRNPVKSNSNFNYGT